MDMRNICDIIFCYDTKNLKFHRRDYRINTALVQFNTFFTLEDNLGRRGDQKFTARLLLE